MTATQQFIEDAVKGGWQYYKEFSISVEETLQRFDPNEYESQPYEVILLDPLAWQAVGKTRRWTLFVCCYKCEKQPGKPINCGCRPNGIALEYQHRFIDHLANGKSIEEALSAIS